jgi:hypothetical protein
LYGCPQSSKSGEYIGESKGRIIREIKPQSLIILLVAFTVITGTFHMMYRFNVGNYTEKVLGGTNPLRWIEYSITATIMIFVIALSSGVYSLDSQVLIVASCFCCMLCGLVAESMEGTFAMKLLVTSIGWGLLIASYGVIFRRFYSLDEDADENKKPPGFVYAIVWGMFVMFSSFGVIHMVHLFMKRNGIDSKRNGQFEMAYTVNSMVSKTLLVGLLFGGLAAGGD